ncbi:MFS transporter [Nocardioides sp. BP30]|uniref:MFS transporter n=1 Tax=Nocardioides sp. BP30 TaxID=3036374 RepID=UPI002468C5EA|nr:MFS transporter [Nocardioides sp. BP30]WGL51326.1 MFS transporter [Nocardioides sp. BP30]
MTTVSDAPETTGAVLRRIAASALLPAFVYEIGNGAIAPIIALVALGAGASTSVAGLMLSLGGVGRILGDVPAALIVDRVGDRRAMLLAAGVTTLALIGCWTEHGLWMLALSQLVIGMCGAVFYLARQSYVSEVVAVHQRARALSTLAGAHRVGLFVGPFIGALAIELWNTRAAFGVAVAATLVTAVILIVVPDQEHAGDRPPAHRGGTTARAMFASHRELFLTLGLAVLLVGAVRAARQTVLPLWASHIGLDATATSLIFGVANAADMSLFYPSGQAMDRFGRLAVAVPSMMLLGLGMVTLPLAHDAVWLGVIAVVMSIGNGIGSGVMMTIGADAAPADGRTTFLSVWRLLSDTGNALGPVVPAVIAGVAFLGLGVSVTGLLGLGAAAGLARWAPRYSPYATPSMARRHREDREQGPARSPVGPA